MYFLTTAHMCDSPPPLENGRITYSLNQTMPFSFGTLATYTCDNGYVLVGGESVRTCDGDDTSPIGYWTGSDPVCNCKYIKCFIHTIINSSNIAL